MKKTISVLFAVSLGMFVTFSASASVSQLKGNTAMCSENMNGVASADSQYPDMTGAAEKSVHAVVHIQVESEVEEAEEGSAQGNPFFDFFFGDRGGNPFGGNRRQEPELRKGSGSGVIISSDGYIVTNNHVVDGAQKIKVILNDKREFEGKVVGKDPNSDIALIKIDAKGLQFLTFGNSDNLKIGEWVLAVGNPFNLTSTVTAGIVSAKSRSININQSKMPIESFIQTDAAVNPGNSGGALVNLKGELVGINTAIASMTGSYAGYSFAVPTTIVQKVVGDMRKYGQVKRALLGVEVQDVTGDVAKENNLDKVEGLFVGNVTKGGAADKAGIKKGDVLISLENTKIDSGARLQELIGQRNPGDKIDVEVKREGKLKHFVVVLRSNEDNASAGPIEFLGSKLREATFEEKNAVDIVSGVKVTEVGKGILKDAGVREGFIITDVNKTPVRSTKDVVKAVKESNGGIFLEGVYPNKERAYYGFGLKN